MDSHTVNEHAFNGDLTNAEMRSYYSMIGEIGIYDKVIQYTERNFLLRDADDISYLFPTLRSRFKKKNLTTNRSRSSM